MNITLAPEGARSDDLDDYAPATHPRNAIEAAIHDTIANTPTPSALPGTTRLSPVRNSSTAARAGRR